MPTTERQIANWKHANKCAVCNAPATHSVTDAQQTAAGWQETAPRYGCQAHAQESRVILIDGTVIPYKDYRVN